MSTAETAAAAGGNGPTDHTAVMSLTPMPCQPTTDFLPAAHTSCRLNSYEGKGATVQVVHVSPIAFGRAGVYGGGERYPWELARAMARTTPTTLVTFGDEDREFADGDLTIRMLRTRRHYRSRLNPVGRGLFQAIADADVVHTHHLEALTTDLALLTRTSSHRVFSTDHGGRAARLPGHRLLQHRLDGLLAVSAFSARSFPELSARTSIIYGGVDPAVFHPDNTPRTRKVVFVGRLLPHKGIDVLIRALPNDVELNIYGRCYSAQYRSVLNDLASDKRVTFHEDADDATIRAAYRSARVAVLPSVYQSEYGPASPRAELLGLTLLEAMACGTPVIATAVGGMPEITRDGVTGLVVPPSDPGSLNAAIEKIVADDTFWGSASRAAAQSVRNDYTWKAVAARCLRAYQAPR